MECGTQEIRERKGRTWHVELRKSGSGKTEPGMWNLRNQEAEPNMEWGTQEMAKRADLDHKELSGRVIDAAIAVHMSLGPGFLESIYERALCVELSARKILFEQQKVVPVTHRNIQVGEHRLDLLVEHCLLVELKAVYQLEDIFFSIG